MKRSGFLCLLWLEQRRRQVVALQKLVKLGSIALSHACRLGDIPFRRAQQANQVIMLEGTARLVKGDHRAVVIAQGLLDEGGRDNRGGR